MSIQRLQNESEQDTEVPAIFHFRCKGLPSNLVPFESRIANWIFYLSSTELATARIWIRRKYSSGLSILDHTRWLAATDLEGICFLVTIHDRTCRSKGLLLTLRAKFTRVHVDFTRNHTIIYEF